MPSKVLTSYYVVSWFCILYYLEKINKQKTTTNKTIQGYFKPFSFAEYGNK